MDYLPIFLDLRGRTSLVVGAGEVARHKIELLLRAHASVRVVAPRVCEGVAALAAAGAVSVVRHAFEPADLDGASLVVAATDDREVNRRVSEAAQARALPVNVVDDPELCSFIVPSIVDRDPVVVAVSTSGAAPALARRLRERLETVVTDGDGALAALLARHREAIKARHPDMAARGAFFDRLLDSALPDLCREGRATEAEALLEQWLAARDPSDGSQG